MSSATDYLENAVINHFFRNSAVTSPSTLTLALYTTAITESGSGTEVAGGGYSRKTITFGAPVDGATANTAKIEYLNMPACTIRAGAVFAGSNMLTREDFSDFRSVQEGAKFTVPVGEIIITVR